MQISPQPFDSQRYARCIEASRRVRWDIDRDVLRDRAFDFGRRFLPDSLSLAGRLPFLSEAERRFYSQVQGRTYGNMFGLVERFVGAKILELTREHWLGDQVALEALVRFSDEELKHQALFRRVERMAAAGMPAGYAFRPEPNAVAAQVLGKSTWSVLALTCLIELLTLVHYRESIRDDDAVCPVWKDVYLHHWQEESQHAILDELEWTRENARLTAAERDAAVDDLIALVAAVDLTLQAQARADAGYFVAACGPRFGAAQSGEIDRAFLAAYRRQYIVTGVQVERFGQVLGGMLSRPQAARVSEALKPIVECA